MDFFSTGSARFLKFMPFILKEECNWPEDQSGQYSNDPDDPGGETKYGIDKRSHPDVDIKNLSLPGALAIYFSKYWAPNGCEALPPGEGEVVMNCCVNLGKGRVKELMTDSDPMKFEYREDDLYKRIADAHPRLEKFLGDWLRRDSHLRLWLQTNVPVTKPDSPQVVS